MPTRRRLTATAATAAGLGAAYAYAVLRFRARASRAFRLADPPQPGTPEFDRFVEVITGAPVRPGNRIEVLHNGCRTFPTMLEAIAAARRTIDFSSYIYWPDPITQRFTEAFIERARAGVRVRMVLDGWGSAKLDRATVDRLEEAGVRVAFYRTPRWYTVSKLNKRMHRRLLVIDGRVGFAGGVGIAEVWTGDATDPDHWRETHARIEGPAVRDILGALAENWTQATDELLAGDRLAELDELPDGIRVQVIRSSPDAGGTAAAEAFYAALAGARWRLWLTTAYFTAGQAYIDALADAARRGVDVRLLLNGPHVDKDVVRKTGQHSYGRLLEAGVRIFEYQTTMLHAKVLLADDWANIGSANFDHRSFALDSEVVVAFTDRRVLAELEKQFLDDLDAAREIHLADWQRRPWRQRLIEGAGELARQSF